MVLGGHWQGVLLVLVLAPAWKLSSALFFYEPSPKDSIFLLFAVTGKKLAIRDLLNLRLKGVVGRQSLDILFNMAGHSQGRI